jgi:hypothetical protein
MEMIEQQASTAVWTLRVVATIASWPEMEFTGALGSQALEYLFAGKVM